MRDEDAARAVIRILERRWSDRLPNKKLPRALVKVLAKKPHFVVWVEHYARHQALPFPDLTFHPEIETKPDGSVVDLLFEELGADPLDFICADCGDDISQGQDRCGPCENWRKTGVAQ